MKTFCMVPDPETRTLKGYEIPEQVFKMKPTPSEVIRVHVNDDGTIDLLDFTIPTRSGKAKRCLAQHEVPTWIMEAISMLRITKENDHVPGLGFKVSDDLYYVVERGANDEQTEP
jgi:hypothetical protein